MVAVGNGELREAVSRERLVAIIRGTDVDQTVAAALTLIDSGVNILEVTLTLEGALEAISRIRSIAPSHALIGAGTVLTSKQVDVSVEAGAQFVVTPSVAPSVAYACEKDIAVLAGAFTPTEVHTCVELGVAGVKLFPASVGGPPYLKALLDPFPTAPLIPVGGVDVGQVSGYLDAGAIAVGVGGPLLGGAAKAGGNADGLAERASAFLAEVRR